MRIATLPQRREKGLAHRRSLNTPGQKPDRGAVEVLTAYSHSAQAVDLRLARPWLPPAPDMPETEREASMELSDRLDEREHRRPDHRPAPQHPYRLPRRCPRH